MDEADRSIEDRVIDDEEHTDPNQPDIGTDDPDAPDDNDDDPSVFEDDTEIDGLPDPDDEPDLEAV